VTYVLVPGAGGEAWYWHRVVPLLEEVGTVVAVDLPTGDEEAGLAEYADAIVAAAGDTTDVMLVAQSMGAFSAPLAVDRLDVRGIVLVNAMVPAPGETAGE
jgi:pimeloyl-ACP methyl ester carboxylesterase